MRSLLLFCFLFLFVCIHNISASPGDNDYRYIRCLNSCQSDCAHSDDNSLTLPERILGWNCQENCRYTCMRKNVDERIKNNEVITKYYGKWPFLRIFGIQEIASTIFSVFNAIPFILFYYRQSLPDIYFMKNLWLAFIPLGLNTWFWSAVYHGRDMTMKFMGYDINTEVLDYFFATLSILYMNFLVTCRVWNIRKTSSQLKTLIPFVLYYIYHCYTMSIHFDYGFNMNVMVVLGIWYNSSWLFWIYNNYNSLIKEYAYKMILSNTIIIVFSLFEIFDFAPYFFLIDAHSIWHLFTPISTHYMFLFAEDDAVFIANQEMRKYL